MLIRKPSRKWAKDMTKYITKEVLQMAKAYMTRGSIASVVREIQHKTTKRCYYIPTGMAETKKTGKTNS